MTVSTALKRRALLALEAFVFIATLCFALPHVASAQVVFDPTQVAQQQMNNFLATSQAWAWKLYIALMIFDLVALTIGALLFRDNLGEFLGGIALKVLVGSVFMYFVVSANTFFPTVINGFAQAGQQAGGSSSSTPTTLFALGEVDAAIYFAAGDAANFADEQEAQVSGDVCDAFECLLGTSIAFLHGHDTFTLICDALGLITALAFAGMFLTYILITIESYIVIFAGVFYIGFAGSRFTMPFSQGYFNYMISVGTKLFCMYMVMGIVNNLLPGLFAGAAGSLLSAAAIPYGFGSLALLGVAAFAALQTLTAAALIYGIPQFAAAFLSGQSGASGNAFLGQIASSTAGMQMMMNGFRGMGQGGMGRAENALAERHLNHGASSVAGQNGSVGAGASSSNVFVDTAGKTGSTSAATETTANNVAANGSSGGTSGGVGNLTQNGSWKEVMQKDAAASGGGNGNAGYGVGVEGSGGSLPSTPMYNPQSRTYTTGAQTNGFAQGGGGDAGRRLPNDPAAISSMGSSPMGRAEFAERFRNTPPDQISEASWRTINSDSNLHEIANEVVAEKLAGQQLMHDGQMQMGLQGLANAVPRDSAPPSAAQIRLSNPDRL